MQMMQWLVANWKMVDRESTELMRFSCCRLREGDGCVVVISWREMMKGCGDLLAQVSMIGTSGCSGWKWKCLAVESWDNLNTYEERVSSTGGLWLVLVVLQWTGWLMVVEAVRICNCVDEQSDSLFVKKEKGKRKRKESYEILKRVKFLNWDNLAF